MHADFSGSLRLVLAVCAALAAKTAAALLWGHAPWLLLLIALVQAAALVPTTSIADAHFDGLREKGQRVIVVDRGHCGS
jgi:PPP family 3-phenylpropionic acid transporter